RRGLWSRVERYRWRQRLFALAVVIAVVGEEAELARALAQVVQRDRDLRRVLEVRRVVVAPGVAAQGVDDALLEPRVAQVRGDQRDVAQRRVAVANVHRVVHLHVLAVALAALVAGRGRREDL